MTKKRIFKTSIVLLLLLLTSLSIAACGGSDTGSGPKTVTFMTWETVDTNKLIDQAMAEFMKQNPDIKVQRIPSPNSDYGQKLSSLVLAKKLPDIFWAGNDTEQQYGAQGLLYDWSSQAQQSSGDFDINKFAPNSLANWKTSDKLYGLPTLMNTYGIWYNEDLFKQAGLPLPKIGWTYDEMLHDAQVLTQKDGGKVSRYGLWNTPDDPFLTNNCAVSAGGTSFEDKLLNPSSVTVSPEFINCAKMFAGAVQNGSVTPPGYNTDTAQDSFVAGKIPMFYNGQWLAAGFLQSKPGFKYGFAPLPQVKKNVQVYDAVGIASPTYIKNPDATWKVMQFLASKAWETVLPGSPVAPAAYVPSSTPYFDTLKKDDLSSVADSVNYTLNTPDKVGIRFVAPWSSKATDVITANWNDILLGKKPLESGTQQMVQQINDIIKSNQ